MGGVVFMHLILQTQNKLRRYVTVEKFEFEAFELKA